MDAGGLLPAWAAVPLRMAALLLFVYLVFTAVVWASANRMMFHPPPPSYAASPAVLRLATSDGRTVAAVHLPNPDARYTVLFSHGNAEDLGDNAAFLRAYRDAGFAVFAYDYGGYGLSTGRPTERGTYRDADAAYEHLVGPLGVPPERIILHGRSIGGAVAAELASRRPCGGLVLESAFLSASRVLTRFAIFPVDKYRTIDRIGRVACPVLIVHGTADEVIGAWHGRRLYALAPAPKDAFWVESAGHNDLTAVAGARYWDALRTFAVGLEAGWGREEAR